MDQTATYTTCATCGSEGTLLPRGKRLRCCVCHKIAEPAPTPEQIEALKREVKLRREQED